jgi:DNA-binding winged helix-turn-helix (wHTH) protein
MISEQVEAPFRIVRSGLFEVDLEDYELRKKGLRVKLQDQPLRILIVLIEHPGEIVSREELRHRLWQPDTFVDFDHSLNTAMMRLREVLGDSSENPRFIETVPRKGCRFVAPVHQVRPDTGEPGSAFANLPLIGNRRASTRFQLKRLLLMRPGPREAIRSH